MLSNFINALACVSCKLLSYDAILTRSNQWFFVTTIFEQQLKQKEFNFRENLAFVYFLARLQNQIVNILEINLTRTISPSWFLTVYLNVLSSYKIAVNVMDLFICDGARVLFQLALIVLYKQVWSLQQFFVRCSTVVTSLSH